MNAGTFDLSPLVPEARPVVERAAAVYMRHTTPWFIGLLAHGSALKGGFVPGCSDVDLQLYLEDGAFAPGGDLRLDLALAIQRDLAPIDPGPFRYVQCAARRCRRLAGDPLGPIPGAYRALAGRLPWPEATARDLRGAARRALAELAPVPAFVVSGLLDHGGGRLAADVRLLCTRVWPVLYHVLTLQGNDPLQTWPLPKERAMALLPEGSTLRMTIEGFYRAVRSYYPAERPVERALAVIEAGIEFMRAAKAWWEAGR